MNYILGFPKYNIYFLLQDIIQKINKNKIREHYIHLQFKT